MTDPTHSTTGTGKSSALDILLAAAAAADQPVVVITDEVQQVLRGDGSPADQELLEQLHELMRRGHQIQLRADDHGLVVEEPTPPTESAVGRVQPDGGLSR